jgi:hypothetical protein
MAARPKLALGGLVKKATESNILEHGTGEQTGDLTSLVAVERKVVLPSAPKAAEGGAGSVAAKAAPKPTLKVPKLSSGAAASGAAASGGVAASGAQPPKAKPDIKDIDLSRYEEPLSSYAIEILSEEVDNPYKDKSDAPIFPLQSRLGFQKQIFRVFSSFNKIPEFGKAPDFDACKKLSSGAQQQVEVYEYQKFVREYMRGASPYRGILVYHGLGSGKTCSAIAAAEALFSVSKKKIIVMTPFSLRDNFIREVSFCGFRHFRLQNHWVKLEKTATTALFAAEVLGVPQEFLKKASTIWIPDFEKPPNVEELETTQRQEIMKQLTAQITSRIEFINYNGITASKLKEIACSPLDAEGNGFFDNKVIVVDEIHNLTRLMQGTIEPYLTSIPGLKRKVPLEPVTAGHWEPALCKKVTDPKRPYLTNYKRGYLLYRLLEGAKNSKIIGLSGTPLINFPEEIAILTNLLGGYIHTSSFTVGPASEENRKTVQKILKENPRIDFEEVELQGLNMSVLITALPEGIIKATDSTGVLGAQRSKEPTKSLADCVIEIIEAIKAKGLKIMKQPEFKSEPLLPPVGQEFRDTFLEADGTTLRNKIVLRKRLQGLISYYRGSKKELMPQVTRDELVRVPFTPYAQAEYLRIRGEELKKQMEQKAKKAPEGGAAAAGKMGNLVSELYELAKMKSSNSYRMFSRQSCNFAFPEGITRPRPRNQMEAVAEIGKDRDIVDADIPEQKDEIVLEGTDEAAEAAEAEDEQIDMAEAQAFKEAEAEGGAAPEGAEASDEEGILISELEPVAPTGPEGQVGPVGGAGAGAGAEPAKKPTLTAMNVMRQRQAKQAAECKRGIAPGEKYLDATKRSKTCLVNFASPRLRLFPLGKRAVDELAAKTAPNPEGLVKYSPKYAAILERIIEGKGSSLVYSQFLDMEGIGIFLVVLRINEFQPIVIEESGKFSAETIKSLKKGPAVNRFLSFTGSESREVRSLALKVFNAKFSPGEEGKAGAFTDLPQEMSDVLVESGFTGNLRGELCRVFCITSAGAEGLSLKNVRRVHIMEPYWNPVRTDQVKGRAVRICSHIDLNYSASPEDNERTVEVFTYCSTFAPEALLHPDGSTAFGRIDMAVLSGDGMKPSDAAKAGLPVIDGVKDYVLTSDEYLYSLSENKKKLLQNIQDLMKTSAVDCQINQYENEEDGLGCITLPGTPEQYAYHPILSKDIAETSTKFKETDLAAPLVAQGAEAPAPQAQAQQPIPGAPMPGQKPQPQKKTVKAVVVNIDGVPYIAVPIMSKSGTALSYDLFARGDTLRTRRIGTAVADAEGRVTDDIVLF